MTAANDFTGWCLTITTTRTIRIVNQKEKQNLPPGQQLVAKGKWPLVGERESAKSTDPWTLTVQGLVDSPQEFSWQQLKQFPVVESTIDIHCVTRWSKLGVSFQGFSLQHLVDLCQVNAQAKFVSFVARTDRQHSSSLPLDEALRLNTMLAYACEGEDLPEQHGGPLRGVVPGKYFYKSVKWVQRIEFLSEDRLGFWEAESGYHNVADPWKEQRYIASSISKRESESLIEKRDFAGRELLGIEVAGHDLSELLAEKAQLRNANFSGCQLQRANFGSANLSNANFRSANLNHASFQDADLEGADLTGADLRGADLSGCSLFGATFCDEKDGTIQNAAKFDAETIIDRASTDALTDLQKQFVIRFLDGQAQ